MPKDSGNKQEQLLKNGSEADDEPSQLLGIVPATGLLLLAIVSIQLGAAIATHLFPILGAEGTVAIRIIFSALLLGLAARGRTRDFVPIFIRNWKLLLVYGLCISAMNFFFYKAIALIPLGAAVAIEFVGPLGVAALASRRPSHFACVGLAALGILLLSPLAGVNLDVLGIVYALLAGMGWALFVLLSRRVSQTVPGNDGLAIGMAIAGLSMIPFAAPVATDLFSNPMLLLVGLGVALLSTTLPFTFEFEALKRLSNLTYGVIVSAEPAVAALVGSLLLGERIGVQGFVAVAFVVIAAIGISITDASKPNELTNN
ncbi:MAG: EamA family transporter [Acidiferrobacterales bacterium]|nr:EamA family transporter [Acidiferrobacterales bacterium]